MELTIRMRHGVAYDLCLVIPKEELDECLLSMPGWGELVNSHGYIRHRVPGMPQELEPPASLDPRTGEWTRWDKGIKRYKVPPEQHLEPVVDFGGTPGGPVHGLDLVDRDGRPTRRLILVGNRNLGNNLWFVAWHRDHQPRCFHLRTEPIEEGVYSCLVWYKDQHLAIERLRFQPKGDELLPYRAANGVCLADEILWCTYGQQALRDGKLVDIEEIIDQFYDIRHVLYFQTPSAEGERDLRDAYRDYPDGFKRWAMSALMSGRPRSRYLHNAVGIGPDRVVILQRHGTVEEIGQWLRDEGAEDGVLLDNGGSVFVWSWWAFKAMMEAGGKRIARTGNVIFSAPDWRPPTISLISFVLKGPPRHEEPPGTVAMAMG